MTALSEHVHRLTREHLTMSAGTPTKVPALLDQLAEAVKPNQSGGATGNGTKQRLPIDATALALWQDIDREAHQHHREMTGITSGELKSILHRWVANPHPDWVAFLEQATLEWCDRITNLLEPAKPYRPNTPCPACGTKHHGPDRAPALHVHYRDTEGAALHPEDWRMTCTACGAEWEGDTLGAIAKTIQAA